MKTLLILGAGTAGTMVANRMSRTLDMSEWQVKIVDREKLHYYQPGFLFIPFGVYRPDEVIRPKQNFLPDNVEVVYADIEGIDPKANRVTLDNEDVIEYDYLVIATGAHLAPEETEGLLGGGWRKNIFDFYTFSGTTALNKALEKFDGGRLVLNVVENPIKCPVAPLEFMMLADWYFTRRGIRDRVELVYVTPLDGAFTKPICNDVLGELLVRKGIHVQPNFNVGEVDSGANKIVSWDQNSVDYDLLVTIPTNMGAEVIGDSGMGDELRFVPTDKHTLQARDHENVFVIGDATNLPASKAGSVAHFELDILVENLLAHMAGRPMEASFDGHANCFIETGFNKGVLIDFNYDVQPLPGMYPLPVVGPMRLLEESALNHAGKMAFRWIYWNLLLPGKRIPVPHQMHLAGKQVALLATSN